ncbi:SUMF1/EgtB/PvdO family nonheme iron enzyme [candidate division KSB1 bacterium]|nr:SUMF1/EgtB/PvdO family nonheme iron enzyme [candidate division KSB1 bacterium]
MFSHDLAVAERERSMNQNNYLFISYARENAEFALRLAKDLRAAGATIWIDQLDIPFGARWDNVVQRALHDCGSLLIILSPDSVRSENVKDEIALALDKGKPIVPVVHEKCEIPLRLRRMNYVDSTEDYEAALAALIASLRRAGLAADSSDARVAEESRPVSSAAERAEAVLPSFHQQKKRRRFLLLASLSLVLLSGVGVLWNFDRLLTPRGMAYIPSGEFIMGADTSSREDEKPTHRVRVNAFYLDQHEVTVAQFREFVRQKNYGTDAENGDGGFVWTGAAWEKRAGVNWRHDAEGNLAQDHHPVQHVSWNDAQAYARWAKKRLPTEAEWEYAARSCGKDYKYAWGNSAPTRANGGNIADESLSRRFRDWPMHTWKGYNDGYDFTAPVGSFAPNELGLYDMTGNVWEWCEDWYEAKYYEQRSEDNPTGPDKGTSRVLRGGACWNSAEGVRCAVRNGLSPAERYYAGGFRCARDVLF